MAIRMRAASRIASRGIPPCAASAASVSLSRLVELTAAKMQHGRAGSKRCLQPWSCRPQAGRVDCRENAARQGWQ
eukprot:365031-Chlamydomonas_euryale.AAC.14